MGRHIVFRTLIKDDRVDIFDFYLAKVAHDAELDTPRRREELRLDHRRLLAGDDRAGRARQPSPTPLCTARAFFARDDLVEAMIMIEWVWPST